MVTDEEIPCSDIHERLENVSACNFILTTPDCRGDDVVLDYLHLLYCDVDSPFYGLPLVIAWLLFLFLGLGISADDFLCPSLVVISKTLKLSQNIAGVTFLAFGNGAPDIFASIVAADQARAELVIGELFGAGVFVITIVVGSICVTKPFKLMERPFLRDIIFYIGASYWTFFIFYTQKIKLWHSIGFIVLYAVYICVVIMGRVINEKQRKKKADRKALTSDTASRSDSIRKRALSMPATNGKATPIGNILPPEALKSIDDVTKPAPRAIFKREKSRTEVNEEPIDTIILTTYKPTFPSPKPMRRMSHAGQHHVHSILSIAKSLKHEDDDEEEEQVAPPRSRSMTTPPFNTQMSGSSTSDLVPRLESQEDLVESQEMAPLRELLFHLSPVDTQAWKEQGCLGRAFAILKAPVYFLMCLTVPVVDYENHKDNWCKLQGMLQCFTAPMFICIATRQYDTMLGGVFPLYAMILLVSVVLALAVYFTSTYEESPKYHSAFGYLGFFTAVCWIYLIAQEIVTLLKAIGIVFSLSDAILGLTVLAWGNSIGDFVSNLTVAKQGYPRMGISACYGGPLLNLLLGIGIAFTKALINKGGEMDLDSQDLFPFLYGTLAVTLCISLVVMLCTNFQGTRVYGICLLVVYVLFLPIAILIESKVIDM